MRPVDILSVPEKGVIRLQVGTKPGKVRFDWYPDKKNAIEMAVWNLSRTETYCLHVAYFLLEIRIAI